MFRRKQIAAAVSVATVMGAFAAPTLAQNEPQLVEEVVVTGSRIAKPNLGAPTPITTIDQQAIEFTGSANSADILRTLPSVGVSAVSSTNSNFFVTGGGINTIDLRNLGEDRTLVLVNGRRYVSGLAGQNAVDFNTIPTELIKRIDVITGGASAIYGSDALAGVVNVILDDEFEGVRVTAQGGQTDESDGETQRFNILMGNRFQEGRGGAVLNFTYSDDDGILARDRKETRIDGISECLFTGLASDCKSEVEPFFSSFPPQGRFNIISTGERLTIADGTGAGATVKSFNGDEDGFNRQAFRRYSVPTERTLASAMFDYQLNDNLEAFAEIMYARTETATNLEPFPLQADDLAIDGIPIDNPFMPQAIRDAAIAAGDQFVDFTRRTVELEQRGAESTRTTQRALFGLRGDFGDNWQWDAFISRANMEDDQLSTGQTNVANFREALNVTTDDNGNFICASSAARIEGCVPVNLFGIGSISQDAADYLSAPALRKQETEQTNVGINVVGDVIELPAGPLAVAFGYEYREEYATDQPDALVRLGQNGGNASAPTEGEFDVNELYIEADIPILSGAPFAEELTLGAAYRYSDYDTIDSTDAYTGRISWAPIESLRFRAQYARAVRAPNINELFAPGGENFATVNDPCNGVTATTPGTIANNCRSVPEIAARIQAVGVFELTQPEIQGTGGFTGRGNPNLGPEESDSYSVGFVYSDNWDAGSLTVSLDWYDIEIEDLIDTVGRQTSLDFCYDSAGFPNEFCAFVERDSTGPAFQLGEVTAVNSGFINEGTLETSGIDLQVDWSMPLFNGELNLRAVYAYLDDYTLTKFGDEDDQTGEVGLAEHEALVTALYSTDRWVVQWETTYIGDSTVDNNQDIFNFDVGDYMLHDLFAAFNITDSFRISAGVDNILDEDAPKILTGVQGNTTGWDTNAAVYAQGAIGRNYYVILDYQF